MKNLELLPYKAYLALIWEKQIPVVSMKERMHIINRILSSEIASIKKKLFISIDIVTVIKKKVNSIYWIKMGHITKALTLNFD